MTATQLQLRRGNTAQHSTFTGAVAEVTVDTDKKVVVVHDGVNAGGTPLATAAYTQAAFDKANTAASGSSANVAYIAGIDAWQNTQITAVNGYAASGYSLANTNAGLISITQGVDATQNTQIAGLQGVDLAQNSSISIIQGVDLTQNTQISGLQGVDLAQNSAISIIQGVDLEQNSAISIIQGVDTTQNTQISGIQGVDLAQNSAISIIQGVDLTQNTNISAADSKAQAAFDKANTGFSTSGGSITGDTVITGNLTVSGTTFYANTVNLNVEDNIITLNSNVTGAPALNGGIEINRGTSPNTKLLWIEADNSWQYTNDGTNYSRIASLAFANAAFDKANTNASDIAVIQGVNTTQNNNITSVNQYAASGYALANTNATNIGIIQGVDNTQNTNISAADAKAQAAFDSANVMIGVNTTQNTNITSVNQYAASAYASANTNATNITYVNQYAASAYGSANTNATNITSVNQYAASAYASSNTNTTNIGIIQGVDNTQNTNITYADSKAQAAFDKANSGIKTTTSATRPTGNNAGDLWYSTSDDTLYQYTYDGTSNNWVDISGPILIASNIVVQYNITANVS